MPQTCPHSPPPHPCPHLPASYWLYPKNLPIRRYQYDMARAALGCNALVALPTGLGKTFIAAVVMLNFYRWFPEARGGFWCGCLAAQSPPRPAAARPCRCQPALAP
jgi:hypothetical protein